MNILQMMMGAGGGASQVIASGGSITYEDGYKIHTFRSGGDFIVSQGGFVEYLVVAGGGGGGYYTGGGGGAGGFKTNGAYDHAVTPQTYSITVGAGGTGSTAFLTPAAKGSNSVFDTITAEGGGLGGNLDDDSVEAGDGGSGGGAGGKSSAGTLTGGEGTIDQGYDGGDGISAGGDISDRLGGGGGGASEVGADSNPTTNVAGDGGDGVASSISGASVTYAGGGGGGAFSGTETAGSGGTGGGGNGSNSGAGTAGTANTGGGGGGGNAGGAGGAGGSGIVIIKYAYSGGWLDWDEAAEVDCATDDIFCCMFENTNASGNETGQGGGLSGVNLVLTQSGSVAGATGTPPSRVLDGTDDYFSMTETAINALIANANETWTLLFKVYGLAADATAEQLVTFAGNSDETLRVYTDTSDKLRGLFRQEGPVQDGATTTNSYSSSTTYYIAVWTDGTTSRVGFTTTRPTKLSDFTSGDVVEMPLDGGFNGANFNSARNLFSYDDGTTGNMGGTVYYVVIAKACLIDNNN